MKRQLVYTLLFLSILGSSSVNAEEFDRAGNPRVSHISEKISCSCEVRKGSTQVFNQEVISANYDVFQGRLRIDDKWQMQTPVGPFFNSKELINNVVETMSCNAMEGKWKPQSMSSQSKDWNNDEVAIIYAIDEFSGPRKQIIRSPRHFVKWGDGDLELFTKGSGIGSVSFSNCQLKKELKYSKTRDFTMNNYARSLEFNHTPDEKPLSYHGGNVSEFFDYVSIFTELSPAIVDYLTERIHGGGRYLNMPDMRESYVISKNYYENQQQRYALSKKEYEEYQNRMELERLKVELEAAEYRNQNGYFLQRYYERLRFYRAKYGSSTTNIKDEDTSVKPPSFQALKNRIKNIVTDDSYGGTKESREQDAVKYLRSLRK